MNPADVNVILRSLFAYIQLGPDLMPIRAERLPPAEYWT